MDDRNTEKKTKNASEIENIEEREKERTFNNNWDFFAHK